MKEDKFKARIITICLPERLLKKIDKIKDHPKWKGNRSAVIEEGMEQFLMNEPEVKDGGSQSNSKRRP